LVSPSWYLESPIQRDPLLTVLKGQNLILNMNDKGFNVVAFNRTTSKVDAFLANEAKGNK
jgi:6-phosphogluconate dehydrogenase